MAEEKRRWFRRRRDGQRGYLVKDDSTGRDLIRLDRGAQNIDVLFNPDEWEAQASDRPFTKAQVARIAFEADRALCRALGDFGAARKPWESMRDEERIKWVAEGIPADEEKDSREAKEQKALRRTLHRQIFKVFPDQS